MLNTLIVRVGLAALVAGVALGGCASGRSGHALYSEVTVSRTAAPDARAVVEQAKKQIIDRGRELGLTVTETEPDRLTVTSAKAPLATGASKMHDDRRVTGTAEFRTSANSIRYRYWIDLIGAAPVDTTAAHERAVLAGLFALRGVFDRPLEIDSSSLVKP